MPRRWRGPWSDAASWAGRFPGPLALLVLSLALCGQGLFSGGELVLSSPHEDMALELVPWREFGFKELRAGNLPLWNPHIFSGIPFLAGFESGLLYPPNWLHLALSVGSAINVLIALHLFAAGLFTYCWCRQAGWGRPAGTLAGAMFMLSGPYYLRIYAGHLPPLWVMTWIPAVFWALDGWFSTRRPGWCLLGMAAVAMQFLGGNPQYAYYSAIGAALYLALSLTAPGVSGAGVPLQSRREGGLPGSDGKLSMAAGWAAIFAGGAALSAAQLLPGFDMVGESMRSGGLGYARASTFAFPPENLLTLVSPSVFGNMSAFPYFGRCLPWDTSLFVGAAGFVLALYGAFHAPGRLVRLAAVMAVATLLLAFGSHAKPLYDALYHLVPGYASVRGTLKFTALTVLFLSRLGGAGLETLLKGGPRPKAVVLGILGASIVLAAAGFWGWSSGGQGPAGACWARLLGAVDASKESHLVPAGLLRQPLFLAGSLAFASQRLLDGAGLLALSAGLLWLGSRSRRPAAALGLLAVVELAVFAAGSTAVMRAEPSYPSQWKKRLEQNPGDYRVLHVGTRFPNIAMHHGTYDVLGYGPLPLRRYGQFLAWTQGIDPAKMLAYPVVRRVDRIFEMLRLRYVFAGGPDGSVSELPSPMPRLQLVREWTLASGPQEALAGLARPGFDPRRSVILESRPDPEPAGPARAGSPVSKGGLAPGGQVVAGAGRSPLAADGTAKVVRSSTDEAEIVADLARPSLLLITDSYSRGWRARPLEAGPQDRYQVLPADFILMAVPLAAGRHRFLLEYAPASLRAGAWLSAVSLAAFAAGLALWARGLGRRRREHVRI
ncbi:MAG: hypothetical protein HY927_06705 [Elusimicrobia bacterium]|nr:hypothetical protein [Elusimicrobiota bacterium]